MTSFADRPGAVVLAAYRPDPELFTVQLRSIRDQTLGSFRCLVGADGGRDEVRRLVVAAVGDDPRFEVVGWDDNVGLYLNVERLLGSLPADAAWVALADQDDRWYPEKLERLVPHLDEVALVSGQARVVGWPSGTVLATSTSRHAVVFEDLLLENQVTGAFTVFRRELLDIALPFPRLHTVTQMHDHWLALSAAASGGWLVEHTVVQDYVQHGGNLVGEVALHRRWTPRRALARLRTLADTYEGGHSPAQSLRAAHTLAFGWRRLTVETLTTRVDEPDDALLRAAWVLSLRSRRRDALLLLWRGLRSSSVSPWVMATMVPGLPTELRLRAGAAPQAR